MTVLRSYCCVVLGVLIISTTTYGSSALVGYVYDAATGELLPARVYVTGSDGMPCLPVPRPGESIFHYDVTRGVREVYATIGAHSFRVAVPPGKTTVTIERGKEYVPMTRKIDVPDGQEIKTEFRLERQFNMAARGWYSGDLHVHTPLDRLGNMQLADDLNVAFPITAWTTDSKAIPGNRRGSVPKRGELIRIDETHVYWNLNTEYEIFHGTGLDGELGAVMILGHTEPLTLKVPPIRPVIALARRKVPSLTGISTPGHGPPCWCRWPASTLSS